MAFSLEREGGGYFLLRGKGRAFPPENKWEGIFPGEGRGGHFLWRGEGTVQRRPSHGRNEAEIFITAILFEKKKF